MIMAQQKLIPVGHYYVHDRNESFLSKVIKFILLLSGWKKGMEKDLVRGSMKQEPAAIPGSVLKKHRIETKEFQGRTVWTVRPKRDASGTTILYFHGGAYIYNINRLQWGLTGQLVSVTGSAFVVPDYPLAPSATCVDVLDFSRRVYDSLLERHDSSRIIFMGDSAGAGLALALAMQLRDEDRPLPDQLILIAPWLDITMSNPGIPGLDRHDKILDIKGLQFAGEAYAGTLETKDYRVSPIYGQMNGLPEITVFIGTHDLFIADARKLKSKLESGQVSFNYFEYPNMVHDWVIIPGLREAGHSIDEIAKRIRNSQ